MPGCLLGCCMVSRLAEEGLPFHNRVYEQVSLFVDRRQEAMAFRAATARFADSTKKNPLRHLEFGKYGSNLTASLAYSRSFAASPPRNARYATSRLLESGWSVRASDLF